MRGEYDMVEETRVKKSKGILGRGIITKLIAVLLFILMCGIFLNTTYLVAFNKMEKEQKIEDEKNKEENSKKVYYIEQKLIKDLDAIKKNQK